MKIIWIETMREEDVETQDSGAAKIWEVSDDEAQIFVRVQSYSEHLDHKQFNAMLNKRVRITVEVIE